MPVRRPKYDRIKPPDPTDPLTQQADRLPSFIKGADGNDPNSHVHADDPNAADAEGDFVDDAFGGEGIGDASKLTAD